MDPDDSPKAAEEDGYSRAPSSRVKDSVNYDEKQHLEDLKEDISHGVARQTTLAELEEHLDEDSDEWDSQSIFEDMYDELFEDKFFPDGEFTQFHIGVLHSFLFEGSEFCCEILCFYTHCDFATYSPIC